jgi:adenosylhomocysteinase
MQGHSSFFQSIIEPLRYKDVDSVIVVIHAGVEVDNFLQAISQFARIAAVIPKSSSKKFSNLTLLKQRYPVVDVDRHYIKNRTSHFIDVVDELTKNERFAIVDMGGYFSRITIDLVMRFGSRFIGVVEDTENGHQKYDVAVQIHNQFESIFPIISVARSSLKDPEDALVGQAIVFSAESVMRERGNILMGKVVGVIGFGKIGRSIAFSLVSRGARVDVYDSNPILVATALSLGFHAYCRSDFLSRADILFCATGNKSISTSDGIYLKNGLHIFCATSSDDELSICLRKKLLTESFLESPHTRRVVLSYKDIYIHNDGNSINFLHGAVVDRFIELVQGEIIYSLGSLGWSPRGRISYLPDLDKKYIARQWISKYGHGRALLC